jgi:hypothetical protein
LNRQQAVAERQAEAEQAKTQEQAKAAPQDAQTGTPELDRLAAERAALAA